MAVTRPANRPRRSQFGAGGRVEAGACPRGGGSPRGLRRGVRNTSALLHDATLWISALSVRVGRRGQDDRWPVRPEPLDEFPARPERFAVGRLALAEDRRCRLSVAQWVLEPLDG